MKVMCLYSPGGSHFVRTGWGRVFQACGHEFQFWRPEGKSPFDAFSEYEPDLFIGTTYDVDRATAKCIAARPKMKVALFASAWGPLVDKLDIVKYPIVVASEQEKFSIHNLKEATGKPDFVFIHVTNRFLEETMGGWRTIGVKPVGILNAADIFTYRNGTFRKELAYDAAMCGGYWPYKARNLDRFILPLCNQSCGLRVGLFGNSAWPVANYLGGISQEDERDLYASAMVCLNCSEPHSTDLNFDCIERPFKVLSSGGFCVSDYVGEAATEIFNNGEVVFCKTPDDYRKTIQHFVSHPEERDDYKTRGLETVLRSHTYFDRVAQMFDEMTFPAEAEKVRITKRAFVNMEVAN